MCIDSCLNIDLHFSGKNAQQYNCWIEDTLFLVEYFSCYASISLSSLFNTWITAIILVLQFAGYEIDQCAYVHARVCVCVHVFVCLCSNVTQRKWMAKEITVTKGKKEINLPKHILGIFPDLNTWWVDVNRKFAIE